MTDDIHYEVVCAAEFPPIFCIAEYPPADFQEAVRYKYPLVSHGAPDWRFANSDSKKEIRLTDHSISLATVFDLPPDVFTFNDDKKSIDTEWMGMFYDFKTVVDALCHAYPNYIPFFEQVSLIITRSAEKEEGKSWAECPVMTRRFIDLNAPFVCDEGYSSQSRIALTDDAVYELIYERVNGSAKHPPMSFCLKYDAYSQCRFKNGEMIVQLEALLRRIVQSRKLIEYKVEA